MRVVSIFSSHSRQESKHVCDLQNRNRRNSFTARCSCSGAFDHITGSSSADSVRCFQSKEESLKRNFNESSLKCSEEMEISPSADEDHVISSNAAEQRLNQLPVEIVLSTGKSLSRAILTHYYKHLKFVVRRFAEMHFEKKIYWLSFKGSAHFFEG